LLIEHGAVSAAALDDAYTVGSHDFSFDELNACYMMNENMRPEGMMIEELN
jgi:hypothetical protein